MQIVIPHHYVLELNIPFHYQRHVSSARKTAYLHRLNTSAQTYQPAALEAQLSDQTSGTGNLKLYRSDYRSGRTTQQRRRIRSGRRAKSELWLPCDGTASVTLPRWLSARNEEHIPRSSTLTFTGRYHVSSGDTSLNVCTPHLRLPTRLSFHGWEHLIRHRESRVLDMR